MQIADTILPVPMSAKDVLWLAAFATSGLVVMWISFWLAVRHAKESVAQTLANPSFFKTVAVMGVVAATAVLSLAGRIDGNLTGAILSGIVGYVLGSTARGVKDKSISRNGDKGDV